MITCVAVAAAAIGLFLAFIGLTRVMNGWAGAALVGLGAAYVALGLLWGWHSYSGVALEGYLSGERDSLIAARNWLGRVLLFPLRMLIWAWEPIFRNFVGRSIGSGLELDERILDVVWLVVDDRQWVLSDRALYVGSIDGYWRIPFDGIQSVSEAPRGPWAHTEVTLAVAGRGGMRDVSGTFTHKAAGRVTRAIGEAGAVTR